MITLGSLQKFLAYIKVQNHPHKVDVTPVIPSSNTRDAKNKKTA